ncbi:hypothetical protein CKO28_09075 [Rhodovibrio sodomensis]|uniref:Glycosyltransferase 2-like domain-containing protein n=1 Tax=Rhodovibrio sodomensis TaxID=1088 RepID=A0ABS1DCJ3_9PROT|nr:glycosyltransferase family 2 protein [Rhodovibrio sodomensis]MBK1668188.1 hypothetical protein [Rhodovibrio sodomensis]
MDSALKCAHGGLEPPFAQPLVTQPARPRTLVIQIPAYNEEVTLALALGDLPRQVEGFDRVLWLVVDDGSNDRTGEVARVCGVDHVVRLGTNRGLAAAWQAGIETALCLGADVIVNTDADNQYQASAIPDLVAPILQGRADIVVGERPISEIAHFTPAKKLLQRMGSRVMRAVSRTGVADAPSGFRALSRDAAQRIVVLSEYTYTLETLIQAGHRGMRVVNAPVGVNEDLRPSRLVRSIPSYIKRSIGTMLRFWIAHRLAGVLAKAATGTAFIGLVLLAITVCGGGFAAASGVAFGFAAAFGIAAALADSLQMNRRLLEDIRRRQLACEDGPAC